MYDKFTTISKTQNNTYFANRSVKNINTKNENKSSIIRGKLYNFKVILLGDIFVGKTSIITRFIEDKFNTDYQCTVGVEFRVKSLEMNADVIANLKIWDTCGEEKYRTITRQYYHETDGIILVFDLTNKKSFDKLTGWLKDIKDNGPDGVEVILVGNKTDAKERLMYLSEQGKAFANKNKMPYIEVSAKLGMNIVTMFQSIAKKMIIREDNKYDKMKEKNMDEDEDLGIEKNRSLVLEKEIAKNPKKTSFINEKRGCCL